VRAGVLLLGCEEGNIKYFDEGERGGGEGEERGLDTVCRVFHSFILSFIDHMV
jgi:hypothetical protein